MTGKFAAATSVSVASSKAEIERTVERYGATGFMSGWAENRAVIAFAMKGRQIRFVLAMPDKQEQRDHTLGRRKSECGRDPKAGPGSCWFWWESCPAKVKDCFARRARAADAAGEEARQAFLQEVGLA